MLSPMLYALGVLYAALGVVILRRARKPSCRECLLRGYCPNRLRGFSVFANLPRCVSR